MVLLKNHRNKTNKQSNVINLTKFILIAILIKGNFSIFLKIILFSRSGQNLFRFQP
jgi:hypothetical protein